MFPLSETLVELQTMMQTKHDTSDLSNAAFAAMMKRKKRAPKAVETSSEHSGARELLGAAEGATDEVD